MEFKNKNEPNKDKIEYGQLSEKQVEKITKNLPPESNILEIGSHKGILLRQLEDSGSGYKLVGSDKDDEFFESIREITPGTEPLIIDITKDPIPNKFDVIVMKLVLGCLLLERELGLKNKGLGLSLQEKVEVWDKVLEKVKNNCKQFILITPALKEGISVRDVNRPIFVPDDILQKLLDKHFKSKELLEVQEEGDKDFNMEIYLLSEPIVDKKNEK